MRIQLISFFTALLLLSSTAVAQERYSDRFELGGQLGGLMLEGNSRYVPHLHSGGRLGYNIDNNLAGELSLLIGKSGITGTPSNATIYLPTAEALYHFGNNEDLRPFVAGGLGVFESHAPAARANTTDLVIPLGGGFKWMFTDNLQGRADIRYMINTSGGKDLHQGYYTLGLSWLFDRPGMKKISTASASSSQHDRGLSPKPTQHQERFPEAAKALERDKRASIHLLVQFDTAQTQIKNQYRRHLREVAEFINQHPNTYTEIEGHTDNVGSKSYNQSLSLRRAQAVRHFLISEGGVNPSKLVAKGYWFSQPITSNNTESGRAKNRRVIATIRAH